MKDRGSWHSADTVGGWTNHYRRMKRWSDAARKASRVPEEEQDAHLRADDLFLSYCIWSHSLLEWILADHPELEQRLKEHVYGRLEWDMVRSFANRTRHFDQTRMPVPNDKYWRLFRVKVPFSEQTHGRSLIEWIVYYDGKRYEVAGVIRKIDDFWDSTIRDMGLDPNEIPDELKVDAN